MFARSEFYFGLQCRTCLRDDANLGALSGRRAEYIVLDPGYTGHLVELREKSPVIYRDIEQRLNTEYQEVFRNPNYQVMRRTAACAWDSFKISLTSLGCSAKAFSAAATTPLSSGSGLQAFQFGPGGTWTGRLEK